MNCLDTIKSILYAYEAELKSFILIVIVTVVYKARNT